MHPGDVGQEKTHGDEVPDHDGAHPELFGVMPVRDLVCGPRRDLTRVRHAELTEERDHEVEHQGDSEDPPGGPDQIAGSTRHETDQEEGRGAHHRGLYE